MFRYGSAFLVLITLLPISHWAQARHHHLRCNVAVMCSSERDLIWATDGQRCYVFLNTCLLTMKECERQNRGLSELMITDEDACLEQCHHACSDDIDPVCAQFFEEGALSFSNKCHLHNFVCQEKKPYSIAVPGTCAESDDN